MRKPFLGIGWGFPVEVDAETDDVRLAEYEESVRQSIWIILGTAKGERVMRPDFGCGIHELVFEVNSPTTAGRISYEVRDALLLLEPRIDVLDVQVESATGGVLLITIDYEIRATNNRFNLVYPFYLQEASTQ